MTTQSALKLVSEALDLAVECGGDLDHDFYAEAKRQFKALVDSITKYDQTLNHDERSPDGNDYNELLALLGLDLPQQAIGEAAA